MENKRTSSRAPLTVSKVIAFLLLLTLVILLRELILFTFFSVILALVLDYPVRLLGRRVSRGLAVLLVLSLGGAAVGGLALLVVPVVGEQIHSVADKLPAATNALQGLAETLRREVTRAGGPQASQLTNQFGQSVANGVSSALSSVLPAARGMMAVLATVFLMIVMAAFLLAQPKVYRDAVRGLIPKRKLAAYDEYDRRLTDGLRQWLGGTLVSMSIMGLLTALGLGVAGIDNWPLLALLTFLATFIPYLGAIAAAVPGLLLALSQSPRHFFYALIVYAGVHFCEGYIVDPLVMKRVVNIPPATLLFGETALGLLLGIPGIIVAAPLLITAKISIQYLYEERLLGKPVALKEAA